MKLLKRLWFAYLYKKAVKKANLLSECYGLRYYVVVSNKKLRVVPKQVFKDLIKNRRLKKGIKIQDIERTALFVTR